MGKMFNLRADPYERADITSNTYFDWYIDHLFLNIPSVAYVMNFIETFKEYPPRQKPEGMDIDQVLKILQQSAVGK
jgi:arylsulfatase